jgi:peroxiredoxin
MSLDTLPAEAVRNFAQKAGINYPIVLADADMAEAYAVEMLPTTVLIDREGRIRHRKVGAMKDPEAYAANVRALLAERAR